MTATLTAVKLRKTNNDDEALPFLVRPRVIQNGPREFIVAVYVLDTTGGGVEETHFVTRIERTGTRARHAVAECTAQILAELAGQGEVVVDDAQAKAVLAKAK